MIFGRRGRRQCLKLLTNEASVLQNASFWTDLRPLHKDTELDTVLSLYSTATKLRHIHQHWLHPVNDPKMEHAGLKAWTGLQHLTEASETSYRWPLHWSQPYLLLCLATGESQWLRAADTATQLLLSILRRLLLPIQADTATLLLLSMPRRLTRADAAFIINGTSALACLGAYFYWPEPRAYPFSAYLGAYFWP